MAERDNDEDDVYLDHPNRRNASAKTTRFIVLLLLLASAGLVLVVTIGGWGKLTGASYLQPLYIVLYLILAFFVVRWTRGVLPMAAGMAMLLGIFAAIAAPEWFTRDKVGFTPPLFSQGLIGLLTVIIVPIQLLLIGFSLQGFTQGWNVEVEVRRDEHEDDEYDYGKASPASA